MKRIPVAGAGFSGELSSALMVRRWGLGRGAERGSVDLPRLFCRWPPWHWGWAGQKQEEARDSPCSPGGEDASVPALSPSCAAASRVDAGLLPPSSVPASGKGHTNGFYGARAKYFLVAGQQHPCRAATQCRCDPCPRESGAPRSPHGPGAAKCSGPSKAQGTSCCPKPCWEHGGSQCAGAEGPCALTALWHPLPRGQ